MPKVLISISADTYVRNYLKSKALRVLREKHECYIIADRDLALAEEVSREPGFLGFYDLDPVMERRHQFLFNLIMWRYRSKSQTFFFRWLRNSNWHLIRRNAGWLVRTRSFIHWFIAATMNPRGIRIPLLANRISFPVVGSLLKNSIKPNQSIQRMIELESFDLILFPSAAFDSVSVDLVSLAEKLKVPTLCLIDNWDNLSSKTVFWKRPDHLGVWGPQAQEQAHRIHGFSPDQVHLIGTPRFDSYFEARTSAGFTTPHDFPYALYVGSAMPFDDIGTLRILEKILLNSENLPPEFRLIYRPHPWQQQRNVDAHFRTEDFSRVILDSQFDEAKKAGTVRGTNDPSFQPDLDYYPGLLLSSRCVVGPLTTMLLEASLCLKPVVALSYFDGYHANTSQRYFSHFDGMEKVPGFVFCNDKESLTTLISQALEADAINPAASDDQTSYFLYRDKRSYPDRLEALVRDIIDTKSKLAAPSA